MVHLTKSVRSKIETSKSWEYLLISFAVLEGFRKVYYGLQGYNKYGSFELKIGNFLIALSFAGLYRDDMYDYTSAVHLEAIRRLPPEVYDQHVFRVVRASQLEFTKQHLPPTEQPSFEEVRKFNSTILNFSKHIFL